MFLEKIISIKEFSTFQNITDFSTRTALNFNQSNIIYAENGVGKTSFSLIFQSLQFKNGEILKKKKRLQSDKEPSISLKFKSPSGIFKYSGDENRWDKDADCIDVFNSFYFKKNVYTFDDINDYFSKKLQNNKDIQLLMENYRKSYKEFTFVQSKYSKAYAKYYANGKNKSSEADRKEEKRKLNRLHKKFKKLQKEYLKNKQSLHSGATVTKEYAKIGAEYINLVNKYLTKFTNNIKLIPLRTVIGSFPPDAEKPLINKYVFSLQINGKNISLEDDKNRTASFDYYLSDGDKNSIALASFLARLETVDHLDKYLVVIDDPFSSFDSNRKHKTISLICELSKKVSQIIVLSHDINFSFQLNQKFKINGSNKSLEIFRKKGASYLTEKDFSEINEDRYIYAVRTLHKALEDGIQTRSEFDLTKSFIRVALEGIFKLKFCEFEPKRDSKWLGDFISYIRDSETKDAYKKFKRLIPYLVDLNDINDYSSTNHHMDPNAQEKVMNQELLVYVKNTLAMIEKI